MKKRSTLFVVVLFVLVIAPNAWSDFCSQYCSPPASGWASYCQQNCSGTPLNTGGTDIPFQVRYVTNLSIGDSFIDITNSGATGSDICVNVFAFTPGEELVSCCSCKVSPNELASFSVRNDINSNLLSPVTSQTSLIIKLVATKPSSTDSCVNSAGAVTGSNLDPGLLAWETTLHANTSAAAGTYAVTETRFAPATLSVSELNKITAACHTIETTGAGTGICNNCRFGGL
jgi:hypothetical protein